MRKKTMGVSHRCRHRLVVPPRSVIGSLSRTKLGSMESRLPSSSKWNHTQGSMGIPRLHLAPLLFRQISCRLCRVRPITTNKSNMGLVRWMYGGAAYGSAIESLSDSQDSGNWCVTRSFAPIGCWSFQMHPDSFWSAPVDNVPWKSKMNGEVPD